MTRSGWRLQGRLDKVYGPASVGLVFEAGPDDLKTAFSAEPQAFANLIISAQTEGPYLTDFQKRISYDPNGNILQYKRNGNNTFASSPLAMDSLSYKYIAGTNQLEYVTDSAPVGNYTVDIDNAPRQLSL